MPMPIPVSHTASDPAHWGMLLLRLSHGMLDITGTAGNGKPPGMDNLENHGPALDIQARILIQKITNQEQTVDIKQT